MMNIRISEENKEDLVFILKSVTKICIVMGLVATAHEFGHLFAYFVFDVEAKWIFLEPLVHRGINYGGIVMGFIRDHSELCDFPTELCIRIIFPLIFQLLTFILLKWRIKILFDGNALPWQIYLIFVLIPMIGDVLLLIEDISIGLWG